MGSGSRRTGEGKAWQVLPFANALAAATALFYLALLALRAVAWGFFTFVFNSQFLGAEVSSLIPPKVGAGSSLATLVVVVVTTWLFGAMWASLYNRRAR